MIRIKNSKYWILCCLTCFLSCNNKKSTKDILEGNFWDILETEHIKRKDDPLNCYYFAKNEKLKYYSYKINKETGKKIRTYYDIFNGTCISYPDRWIVKNDSVIDIMGFDYKIKFLAKNKIHLQNLKDSDDYSIIQMSNMQ